MSDESDGEEHYYSGSEEGDESHESESDGANHGLLDLEASEASSEPDHDAERFSDDGSYDGSSAEYTFPKFMQLPPEIREMVWGAFCPDLGAEPRVFELHLHTIISPPGAVHLPTVVRGIVAGPQLENQTAPMRAVLAVHQESRALGLKSAPHGLSLSRGEFIPCHHERDVLFVAWNEEILFRGIAFRFQELGIKMQNIAFPSLVCSWNQQELVDLMYLLPQAKRLFILDEEEDLHDPEGPHALHFRDYAWTVTEKVHNYRLDTEEEGEFGLSIPVSRIFCWPDLDNFPEFAKEHVTRSDENAWWKDRIIETRLRLWTPLEDSRDLNQDDMSDEEKREAIERLQNIEVWPMIRFNFGAGLDRFRYMESRGLGRDRLPPDDLSESETSEDIEDEYESSGIDDEPIDEYPSDDDEDELLGQHLGHDTSHLHGSSSQLFDDTSEIEDPPPANFSSDEEVGEQDHITLTSDPDNDSGSQTRASRRKRRVVGSDSDGSATETEETPPSRQRPGGDRLLDVEDLDVDNDDESSDVEPMRGANRRARPIAIDSEVDLEDEDEEGHDNDDDEDDVPQPSRSGRRRGRAVPADSEDDDDGEVVQQPSGSGKRRGRIVQVDSDEEDEDDESDSQGGGAKTKDAGSSDEEESSSSDNEDDDPPAPPKRMSLAKRLSLEGRQARSRHLHHDDDPEADEMTGDGYGYSDDQEDEVDESDNSMVMGMAEEYEGEDGESEEEY